MVMMREQTRILWKKTEQMDRESSVQRSMFEVRPLPVYEEDPYQCRWHIVPPARRRLSPQSPWRRERGGAAAAAPRVCNLVVFDGHVGISYRRSTVSRPQHQRSGGLY